MGRPPLPLGSWGKIRRYQVGPKSWRAMANYRDYDGVTRPVERSGASGAKAERRLVEDLTNRARVSGNEEITADTRMSEVCRIWMDDFRGKARPRQRWRRTRMLCGFTWCRRLALYGCGK